MKFGYVLSKNGDLIEVCRVDQLRFDMLIRITGVEPIYLERVPLIINKTKLITEIKNLLSIKQKEKVDYPGYKGRFREDEIFEMKYFEGVELKLCNSSNTDNTLIFLLNILDALQEFRCKLFLFFAKNHKELRLFLKYKL